MSSKLFQHYKGTENTVQFTVLTKPDKQYCSVIVICPRINVTHVTHLDETSHMSAEFVFRYGPKCMGGLILTILVLLHKFITSKIC